MNKAFSTIVKPQMIESPKIAKILEMRHGDLLRKIDGQNLFPITLQVFGLKGLRSTFGVNVKYLPEA